MCNINTLVNALQTCKHCSKGPLDLANTCKDVKTECACAILRVLCSYCGKYDIIRPSEVHRTGSRGPPTFDVNSRAGFGTLHAGIGYTHYSGIMETIRVPTLARRSYRKREREAGNAVVNLAKSCRSYLEKEKSITQKEKESEDLTNITVSYDMGCSKGGHAYDSSSGTGSAIGLGTGKVISYATQNS